MPTPILTTKLYAPPIRPEFIARPRLRKQLHAALGQSPGLGRKLTLISAPAGFGKSTLVSEWLHQIQLPTAWLSLDAGDNDPNRFLIYLVAALQTIAAEMGNRVLAMLQSTPPPPTESLLTALLNEITTVPNHIVLVLDDYHVIKATAVHDAVTFLLDYLPTQMHLIITTREDPPLPLARYRVRGQLLEMRAADLRFTPSEAATFFNQVMGLNLSGGEITALEARTEGWIAGLQMAALAMQGATMHQPRADIARFIQDFTGSHRFVLDYLVEEVLQHQHQSVRTFLLQTAILDQLTGPLCDAVTGQRNGKAMLETLERGNLFVIPLDAQRQWYRYHHLFADVLLAHLVDEQPDQVRQLHLRASAWYAQHGRTADAIRHAFAAEDYVRAATLVEMAWPAIFNGFHPATWLSWVQTLPDALVRARPVLSVGYAWTLLDGGALDGVEERLNDAALWLDLPESSRDAMVVVNEEEFRTLPSTIASGRAYLARARGQLHATVAYAQRALELLPEEDHYWRGIAAMFLGQAYRTSGDLTRAYQAVTASITTLHRAGHLHFQIVGTVTLADIRAAQGRLHDAAQLYARARQLAEQQPATTQQGTVDLFVGLSELAYAWNDLDAATQHLQQAQALADYAVTAGNGYRMCVAQARIKAAQDDFDGALALLHEAEHQHPRGPFPELHPATAQMARIWLRQQQLSQALAWATERKLSGEDELSYLHEFEHITLARVLIAESQSQQSEHAIHAAMQLIDRLLRAAQAGGRVGSEIEILVLQALAYQLQGDIDAALAALHRALERAEPEGYIRVFVDEGEPIRTLLATSLARGANAVYITRLFAALQPSTDEATTPPDPNQLLIEPLSQRELEVLRLLAAGHPNQAVADDLVIALSTVKKHVNNIFGKLGVTSRTQAVSRARELELL